MTDKKRNLYSAFLHCLLIAFAGTTVALAWQNRVLERRFDPPEPESPFEAGDVVEPFAAQDLEGRDVVVNTAVEGKDRWIFFFTTTCGACRENQRQWRRLHEQFSDRHDVVGVSFDPIEATRRYREELDLPYRIVTVLDGNAFVDRYGVQAVPFTLHIGADGKVRDVWLGVLSDSTLEQFRT